MNLFRATQADHRPPPRFLRCQPGANTGFGVERDVRVQFGGEAVVAPVAAQASQQTYPKYRSQGMRINPPPRY